MNAVRYNEKVKRLSTLLGGAGLAFILTAITRWLDRPADTTTAAWIILGAMFIWAAIRLNDLLQPEEEL